MKFVRLLIPVLVVPLCLAANLLAAAPWLRAFPVSVAGAPLYGAAVLSVLVPLITVRIRPHWVWLGFVIDVVAFAIYTLVVVLQDPTNVGDLVEGLYRGPSQLLTFALPLVSPRTLMVAPVAATWLAGALAGECTARRWYTMFPYIAFLVAFGLAYGGTQRAAGSNFASARMRETVLAAALLVVLLLMRVVQAWVRQDETAETTQPDGILPLRGLLVGTVTTLVIALIASLVVQADAFPKHSDTPQRVPTVNDSNPLTPLSFVAGLRPRAAKDASKLFQVSLDRPSPGYIAIANVDLYDGSGWSFDRTFRPSGGVLPADADPGTTRLVTQQYNISSDALTSAPWMPFLSRPKKVTGTSVNIDPSSGMIVPAGRLRRGQSYTVQSDVSPTTFDRVKAAAETADAGTPTVDTQLPDTLRLTLNRVVKAFTGETSTASSSALPFLQALQRDLRANYSLSDAAQGSSNGTSSPSSTSSPPPSVTPTPTPDPTSSSALLNNSPAADLAGGTGFSDVLASILGPARSGTPEQFSTMIALVARYLQVPARVVTGFRVRSGNGAAQLPAGQYNVTTADAWTWVEVALAGSGWVVLDGSPGQFSPQDQQTESAAASPLTTTAPPSQNALITQGNKGHAAAPNSNLPATASAPDSAVLIALLVALGVLVLVILMILGSRKWVRATRRRRMSDPRARLIGAWEESLDVLIETGLPELATLTSAEIAALTGAQFGAESGAQAASLGAAANAVVYSAATVVAPADADAAWSQQRTLRREVRRQLGFRDRLVANLRYHRAKKTPRPTSPPSWAVAAAASRSEALGSAIATRRNSRREH